MEWLDSLIDRDHCLYTRPRGPKGHAPSVWSLRNGLFVDLSFRGLALS